MPGKENPNRLFTFTSPYLRAGSVDLPIYLQEDGNGKTLRAPFLLLLPGVFGSGDEFSTRQVAESFWRRGYHVAIFPNAWSTDYIHWKPVSMPGNLVFESNLVLEFARSVRGWVGLGNVTSTSLFGISYGALLGSAAVANDQDSGRPIFNGKTLFVSPPLALKEAAERLDDGIDRTGGSFGRCKRIRIIWPALWKVFFGANSTEADLSPRLQDCMRSFAFMSFQKGLVSAIGAIRSSLRVHAKEEGYGTYELDIPYLPKRKDTRFLKAFREDVPENLPLLDDPSMRLAYWMNRMDPGTRARAMILTSRDDFLNEGLAWSAQDSPAFAPSVTARIGWGGHGGILGDSAFQALLDLEFGKIRR